MRNDTVHYRLKYTNWHFWKCIFRASNTIFGATYGGYNQALEAIDKEELRIKAKKKVNKESFTIHRTKIPSHIPLDQRLRYVSTEKITDL